LTLGFLPNPNPVRNAEPSRKVVAPFKAEALAVETVNSKPAEKPNPVMPVSLGTTSAAAAAPVATVKSEGKPDVDQLFREALSRLQNRIRVGLAPGIEFKKGESVFSDKSKVTLDQVGKLLEHYPQTGLTVLGYDADNALAQARGTAALKYLTMNFRVNAENLQVKVGDPAQQPKNSAIAFEVGKTGR
jgi:outer membrane protein OmpA-like peptidoglycan-associated protein